MPLTYGRHRPRNSPPGDYASLCFSCQAKYYRSRLLKDRSGRLLCRNCKDARDELDLADAIAAAAAEPRIIWGPKDGGQADEDP